MVNHNCTADLGVAEGSASMSGHAGLHALGRFCEVLGLGELLSGAYRPVGERKPVHDRGKALVQALLVFAGGGEACSDIKVLRAEGAVFGSVPSASTLYRVACGVDAGRRGPLQGRVRFCSMDAFADSTGECLAVLLRPGNAACRRP